MTDAVQEKLNVWLLKTQKFLNEVASPLVSTNQSRKTVRENYFDDSVMEDIFVVEQTINSRMPQGSLSLAAIVSIEQFSRWKYVAVAWSFPVSITLVISCFSWYSNYVRLIILIKGPLRIWNLFHHAWKEKHGNLRYFSLILKWCILYSFILGILKLQIF